MIETFILLVSFACPPNTCTVISILEYDTKTSCNVAAEIAKKSLLASSQNKNTVITNCVPKNSKLSF